MKSKDILVTGGAGYIGAHMVRLLLENGYRPVVFDNLSTGFRGSIPQGVPFVKGDLRRAADVKKFFDRHAVDAVMHFAGSTVVSESVHDPLKYYENNISSTINLLKALMDRKVGRFIFSSTAAMYGNVKDFPLTEQTVPRPTNPYTWTKAAVDHILSDVASVGNFRYVSFRYFNVAGAHSSGEIGFTLRNSTFLVPNIMAVLTGRKKNLEVFGHDYDTPDGTCIRDYIYVMDLCQAHLMALKALEKGMNSDIFNLGTAHGHSVKEVVDAAQRIFGKKIPMIMKPRRPGDVPKSVADYKKALKILGWRPKADLETILETAWKWEEKK